jgi:hypothetical protein
MLGDECHDSRLEARAQMWSRDSERKCFTNDDTCVINHAQLISSTDQLIG